MRKQCNDTCMMNRDVGDIYFVFMGDVMREKKHCQIERIFTSETDDILCEHTQRSTRIFVLRNKSTVALCEKTLFFDVCLCVLVYSLAGS
jgi:hypothetical protein